MATITLYAGKVNQMAGLLDNAKNSVNEYVHKMGSLKWNLLMVDGSVCNVDDVVDTVKASTQTQVDVMESLETLKESIQEYVADVVAIDRSAAEAINRSKEEFYDAHRSLRPECEKNHWEKFKDGCKKFGEWCREHWKAIAAATLVAAAVAVVAFTAGTALGPVKVLLLKVAEGILLGSAMGGLAGGLISAGFGGSFWEGLEEGAFGGAFGGAISFGLSAWSSGGNPAGLTLGKTVFIGAVTDAAVSVLSDFGDKKIKGEEVSGGGMLFNATLSAILGGGLSWVGYRLAKKFIFKISGINKGNGSWAHVWASQSTRSLKYGYKVSFKSILKSMGVKGIEESWDYLLELFKNITSELMEGVMGFGEATK